jgi:hypothetical protein
MPSEFHRIMQDPANADHIRPDYTVEQKMPRPAHDALRDSRLVAAMAKVVATHARPELRSKQTSGAFRISSDKV